MDEFDAIMSGGKAAPGRAAAPAAKTYDPFDAAIRTIYGESGGDPEETRAIASVIVNRAKKSGKPFDQVVLEPGQFEPWGNAEARKRIEALDPKSAEYQTIASTVGGILGGKENPYPGLTHFYAPAAQAAAKDGRPPKPDWDNGTGQMIGKTMFLGLDGAGGADDFDALMAGGGVSPDAPPTPEEEARFVATYGNPDGPQLTSGITPYKGMKETLPPTQQKTYETLVKAGMLGEDDEAGSARKPFFMQNNADVKSLAPGAYYVDREGQLARVPGGPDDHSFGKGFGQGMSDIPLSVAQLLPGTDDSEWGSVLKANQMGYDAAEKGNLLSGAGRFTGQLVGSAPLMGAAELAAAPVVGATGLGRFVLGRAGMEMAPGAARLATRAGSLATEGALQGAGGAALVSSASDAPLDKQMATGAVGGALLGPALPAIAGAGRYVGQTVKSLVEPLTEQGRSNIANRIISNFAADAPLVPNAEEFIPGSVPTLAQATANPGVATLERTVRLGRPTPFAERSAANAEARGLVLDGARGDEHTVADLVQTRNGIVDQARNVAFQGAGDVDAAPVVAALDEALTAPAAHMDDVARPLQQFRDKLVQPPADTTPAEAAQFMRTITKTFGADADALTPDVMSAARSKLGAEFERLAGSSNILADDSLKNGLAQVIHDAGQVIEEAKVKPLQNLVDQVLSTVQSGSIPGRSYQALIRKGGPLDILSKSQDGAMRHYAGQIRETLDDALERTMASDFPGDRIPRSPEPFVPGQTKAAEPVAPATPQAAQKDATDQALEYLRSGKGAGRSERGPSLADALIKAGGLKDDGELAAMDAKGGYGKRGGLLVRGKGMSLDEAAQWAQERGYVGKPDLETRAGQGEFLEALRKDLDGDRVYANGDGVTEDIKARAADLEEMLAELGIDPKTMPNGRIRAEIDSYFGFKPLGSAPGAAAPEAPMPKPVAPAPAGDEGAARGREALDQLRAVRLAYKNLKTVEAALRTAGPDKQVTPQAVLSAVKRNFGQYAYQGGGPLGDAAESAVTAQAGRTARVETNAQQVYGMRQGLTDAIDKLEAKDTDAAREAANHLKAVRDRVDAAIGQAAPAYGDFLEVATRSAEPIEAQKYLQSLRLTDTTGKVTLGKVDNALERIKQARAKPGKNPAKSITDATLHQLERLRQDLLRENNSTLGKPMGSDTAQHIVTNNISAQLNAPLGVGGVMGALSGHPLVGAALGAGKMFYGMKDKEVMDVLASKLLMPEAPAVNARPAKAKGGRGSQLARPVVPVLGSMLSNRLVGQ